jgi:hypothetical protein
MKERGVNTGETFGKEGGLIEGGLQKKHVIFTFIVAKCDLCPTASAWT